MTTPLPNVPTNDLTESDLISAGYAMAKRETVPMFARGRWGNPADLSLTETTLTRSTPDGAWLASAKIREVPARNPGGERSIVPASRTVEVWSRGYGCIMA